MHRSSRDGAGRRRNERGALLVETSLVVLVLLTVVWGIMEFSYTTARNNELEHAAGEGARAAAVGENITTAVCGGLALIDPAGVDFTVISRQPLEDGTGMSTLVVTAPWRSLTGTPAGLPGLTARRAFFLEPGALGALPAGRDEC